MAAPLDTEGMWAAHASLPEQVEQGFRLGHGLDDLPDREAVEHVVVLGMGGSGIAGDIALAAAAPFMSVPVVVVKSYELPHFVGEGSLVFAVSFSGETEEVCETATDAAVQGARVVAVTGGGELAKLASGWGAPTVSVPTDVGQPRAALGWLSGPVLGVLDDIGLFPGAGQWVDQAVQQLRRRRDQVTGSASPARDLARAIGRTIPVVHGGGATGATAAQRWKTQVNENAKAPAFWSAQPELCHNEVVGWGQHGDVTRQTTTLVQLRHDNEHPQVSRRHELVADLVREAVADVLEVRAEGDGELAQLLDLILLGDFVSLELAAAEGLDPGPVPVLTDLKQALAAR